MLFIELLLQIKAVVTVFYSSSAFQFSVNVSFFHIKLKCIKLQLNLFWTFSGFDFQETCFYWHRSEMQENTIFIIFLMYFPSNQLWNFSGKHIYSVFRNRKLFPQLTEILKNITFKVLFTKLYFKLDLI